MRALVTGAGSYIGTRLVTRLAAAGAEVHVLLRPHSDATRLQALAARPYLHRLAAARPDRALLASIGPDAIFHLAAPPGRADTGEVEAYLTLSLALAEAALAAAVPRFVNVGTWWQFGPDGGFRPNGLYAAAKQAVHDLMAGFAVRGLSVCTAIPFDVYGPGDWRGRFVSLLKGALDAPLAASEGLQEVDLIHVDDVAAGFLAAARAHEPAGTAGLYTLGSNRPLTLRAVAEAFAGVAGRPAAIEWGRQPYAPDQVYRPCPADSPPPGWSHAISREQGLAEVIAHA
ncbi:MAG: NAD(P)-dependent oxidoreductase, partial [Magnetospirillum sp.]|nr:NAD(P)-dependent oxidoreductase [Magnetospirillum sp.]